VVITCPTTSCPVSGLKAETSYVVQASLQWNACAARCAALRCAVLCSAVQCCPFSAIEVRLVQPEHDILHVATPLL
jgi:hypothetical protein